MIRGMKNALYAVHKYMQMCMHALFTAKLRHLKDDNDDDDDV